MMQFRCARYGALPHLALLSRVRVVRVEHPPWRRPLCRRRPACLPAGWSPPCPRARAGLSRRGLDGEAEAGRERDARLEVGGMQRVSEGVSPSWWIRAGFEVAREKECSSRLSLRKGCRVYFVGNVCDARRQIWRVCPSLEVARKVSGRTLGPRVQTNSKVAPPPAGRGLPAIIPRRVVAPWIYGALAIALDQLSGLRRKRDRTTSLWKRIRGELVHCILEDKLSDDHGSPLLAPAPP